MDLNLIREHCAHCGSAIAAGQAVCARCQQSATDPAVMDLAEKIDNPDVFIPESVVSGGCPNIAWATLMLYCLGSDDLALAASAGDAIRATREPVVLKELVVLLGTRKWLGQAERGRFTHSAFGDRSIAAVIRSAFVDPGEVHARVLIDDLHNVDSRVREAVVDLLQYQGYRQSGPALIEVLRSDRDPAVRARAAQTLGLLCDPDSVEPLIRALHDESNMVQSRAARALSRLGAGRTGDQRQGSGGSAAAIKALIDSLKSPTGLVRLYAEQALIHIGDPVLVPLLETLIHDSEAVGVRDGILYVLRTMPMPDRHRAIILPIVEAGERLNASIEIPAAAYEALGTLQGVTAEHLRTHLNRI